MASSGADPGAGGAASMRPSAPRLVTGSIAKHLWELSAPMLIGLVAMSSYSVADTYFVGQLGTLELAALGFTFPVSFSLVAVGLGIGVGASSVLARLLGSGDRETVQRIATHSMLLAALLGFVVMFVGLASLDRIFTLLGADERTLPLIREYMEVYYFGGFLLILPLVGNFAMRAVGDARLPALILSISALANIILDPLLIFGWFGLPRLELRGAAIATVIANGITVIASLAILYRREHLIRARFLLPARIWESWRGVLHVGVPATAANLLNPLTVGVITALVADFGPEAVAGYGVASRVESFVMIVIFAVSSSVTPFAGQNYGAGRIDRVRDMTWLSGKFCLAYGVAVAAVLWVAGEPLAGIFNDNPAVIETAAAYLSIVPVTLGAFGFMLVAAACFNALGMPLPATALTFVKLFVFYVPLAWVLSSEAGLIGVFLANAISHVLFGIAAFVWLRRTLAETDVAFRAGRPAQAEEGR
ncbi:MAG: MATE family efflux transporter [Gammaproteobacteria bacterium]|nr:MATE family efflux transporter [Gammaproteobacteria bacterium]